MLRHVLIPLVLSLAATVAGAEPLPAPLSDADFRSHDPAQVKLGQLLFHDKILSGNRNIACATCHHPRLGTGDGLSLGIGEGGAGLGPKRTPGRGADKIAKRVPRNAPPLWNLGHREVEVLLRDGRVSVSDLFGNGFDTPAEEFLPLGLTSVTAAQALMPLAAEFEMAGNVGENEVIGAVRDRFDLGWPILAKRVRVIPDYGDRFVAAFDHIDAPEEVTIVEIANALAAFMEVEFRSHDSPFDAYLDGDRGALDTAQLRGKDLFYGEAGCAACHSGPLLTDHAFHALALPQFGPGRTRRFDPYARDVGRMGETDLLEDAYRFRTPSLRNVALTAPYGHNGAYPTLEAMVRHHAAPAQMRAAWTPKLARLPEVPWLAAVDFVIQQDRLEAARHGAVLDIAPVALSDGDVADLVAFLGALTGDAAGRGAFGLGVPGHVPSGLPVDR